MNKSSIIAILKKHYLLLSISLIGILLLGWVVMQMGLHPVLSTPIATIEPEDSLASVPVSSKLESYLEELKPDPAYRAAREEVMAMDFSRPFKQQKQMKKQKPEKDSTLATEKLEVENKNWLPSKVNSSKKFVSGLPVRSTKKAVDLSAGNRSATEGFYTIKSAKEATSPPVFARAVIEGNHILKAGATLRLRLKEEATFSNQIFPQNTLLYGTVGSASNGRLKIRIARIGTSPVPLTVYDQDMQEGLVYQIDELVSEALKESSQDALDEVFYSLPYGGIAGGIARLGRNLFNKTRTKQEVFLADGYPVLIATSH